MGSISKDLYRSWDHEVRHLDQSHNLSTVSPLPIAKLSNLKRNLDVVVCRPYCSCRANQASILFLARVVELCRCSSSGVMSVALAVSGALDSTFSVLCCVVFVYFGHVT